MKILHWDENFHPNFGYQINILPKYQVKQGHEVVIFTSQKIHKNPAFSKFGNNTNIAEEDRKYSEKYGIKIVRLPVKFFLSGRVFFKKGFIDKIISEKPDVIMVHSNDSVGGIAITKNLDKINLPIVFDNHMLEMASQNPLRELFRSWYRKNITPHIISRNLKVIRTQDDNYVNKHLGLPSNLTPFIPFGTDVDLFKPNLINRDVFRKKHNIDENDFVVLYVGKMTKSKGSKLFANAILEKIPTQKKVFIIVVGNANGRYEKEAVKLFSKTKNHFIHFPTQKYEDLAIFYEAADLCVFPKQCSLSFYDAQACGVPVLAENNNINIDRLNHSNGMVFESGNYHDLRSRITLFANMEKTEINIMGLNASTHTHRYFNYDLIAQRYTKILTEEVQKFTESIQSQK